MNISHDTCDIISVGLPDMVSSDSQTYWIGLRKIEQEEGHRWLDGGAQVGE